MAGYIPTNIAGGFSYTPVSYTYGSQNQNVTGGLAFSLPLSSVAAFTNSALDFSANNTKNSQNFLAGVITQAQGNVGSTAQQAFKYQDSALQTQQNMFSQSIDLQQYALKKQFQMGILSPASGCFITTAITQALGLSDDCWQLQLLRKFRDEFLLPSGEGAKLVQDYYAIAPQIVAALDSKDDKASIYAHLANTFIYPALQEISRGNNEQATGIYQSMVEVARLKAGVVLPVAEPAVPAAPASAIDSVASAVEGLAPVVAAIVPGAAQTAAVVEEVAKVVPVVEPVLTAAVHAVETALHGFEDAIHNFHPLGD